MINRIIMWLMGEAVSVEHALSPMTRIIGQLERLKQRKLLEGQKHGEAIEALHQEIEDTQAKQRLTYLDASDAERAAAKLNNLFH